jgi:phage/plasmid-associated DNA primase
VINFEVSFVDNPIRPHERQKDPEMGEKLAKCTSAFIAILIEFFRRFLAKGLHEAPHVTAATAKYQTDNDIFAEFRDLYLVEDAGRVLNAAEAQETFRRWTDSAKKRKPKKIKEFLEANLGVLSENGHKDAVLKKTVRGWKGWKFAERG